MTAPILMHWETLEVVAYQHNMTSHGRTEPVALGNAVENHVTNIT